jgi:solute carrier family 25 carnitine/acylcarnitine transporter 20/29
MIGAVPIQNALLMSGYGIGKRWSDDQMKDGGDASLVGVFVGGCTGGILQSFIMSPVELIKVTQQVWGQSTTKALSTVGVLRSSIGGNTNNVSPYKLSSLWRGLDATLWRDGIPHGVWFASYEFLKNRLDTGENSESATHPYIPMYHSLWAGAFAATCAWLVGVSFTSSQSVLP